MKKLSIGHSTTKIQVMNVILFLVDKKLFGDVEKLFQQVVFFLRINKLTKPLLDKIGRVLLRQNVGRNKNK